MSWLHPEFLQFLFCSHCGVMCPENVSFIWSSKVTPTECHRVWGGTKGPPLLFFESVQSRFLARKHCRLLLPLLSLFFHLHFVLHSLPDYILGGGEQNRLAKHCRHCWKITKWLHQFYSGLLTLWSSWATCFLRLSTLPAELRPFFLYLGVNFSLASGSKPWEDKNVF